jgi:TPR repeat protein
MGSVRNWWLAATTLAGAVIAGSVAHEAAAAWPDGYPGRVAAVDAIRHDMAMPGIIYDPQDIKARYEDACKKKSSSACNWTKWQGANGGDLKLAREHYAGKCPSDPLACVVLGYTESRDDKGNLVFDNPAKGAKALDYFTKACKEKAYAPGCTGEGELYLNGIGTDVDLERARKLVDEGCKAEDPWGCYLLGTMYENGQGGPADFGKAAELYKSACSSKIPHACVQLGTLTEDGRAGTRNPEAAAKVYGEACEGKFTGGCYQLGRLYAEGRVVQRSPSIALGMYKTACDGGDFLGCYGLATFYESGEAGEGDIKDAAKIYDEACSKGYAKACTRTGEMYIKGRGLNKDVEMGVKLIQKGCSGADPGGCDTLGALYENGNGLDMNLTKAAELYKMACERGEGKGCYHLGNLYEVGKGVSQSATESQTLFQAACDKGHGKSCGRLARRYLTGDGVEKNMARAAELLGKGCAGQDGDSCGKLAGMYQSGKGVSADPAKALQLYTDACDFDNGQACFELAEMYAKGSNGVAIDFKKAAKGYSRGCSLKFDKACEAGKSVVFQARFEEVIAVAWESNICQVWSLDPEAPEKTKLVATVRKEAFEIQDGPLAGNTVTLARDPNEFKTDKKVVGFSKWRFNNGKKDLTFRHYEVWDPEEEPIDTFPGDMSYSDDRLGDTKLLLSREEETIRRSAPNTKCSFAGGYPVITVDHCSEIQALAAAQLVTSCKGE